MFVEERKAKLRLTERNRWRLGTPLEDLAHRSLLVQEHFLSAFPPRPGQKIALYAGIRGEVRTDLVRSRCHAAGALVFYPRVMEDAGLAFFLHGEGDGWVTGRYGLFEPPTVPGSEGVRNGFDLVAVPGMAFDARGGRLGRGCGYYDRFLLGIEEETTTVGLAFSWQIVAEVPVDAWDVPVDAVVTENGLVRDSRDLSGRRKK